MILEKTTNKERVMFWKSRGFPEATYFNGNIISEVDEDEN
jgi:hypothetical protein